MRDRSGKAGATQAASVDAAAAVAEETRTEQLAPPVAAEEGPTRELQPTLQTEPVDVRR